MALMLAAGFGSGALAVMASGDSTLVATAQAAAERALSVAAEHRQDLATRLQNAIAKGMGAKG